MIVQHPSSPVNFNPPDTCPDCHLPMRFHRGVTGTWLTCEVSAHIHRINDRRPDAFLSQQPDAARTPMPKHPERWNDHRPQVTAAVHVALTDGTCGPEMEILLYGLDRDLQLAIAHKVATVAIEAYLAGRQQ